MRWVVTAIAVLAVGGCIVASAYMNWLFMTGLGKSDEERHVFGMVSLAVSGFLAVLPVLIIWAVQGRQWLAASVGVVLFAVCATVSGSSAVGFSASNRGEMVGARDSVTEQFESDQQELADAESRLKELPQTRLASVVASGYRSREATSLLASLVRMSRLAPASCNGISATGISRLKKELAAADERAKLRGKIDKLRADMNGLRDKGAGRESDAQAAVIGRLLGVGKGRAQEGLALLLAFVVELMAGFGFYVATSHLTHRKDGQAHERREGRIIDITPADLRAARRVGGAAAVAQIAAPRRVQLAKRG